MSDKNDQRKKTEQSKPDIYLILFIWWTFAINLSTKWEPMKPAPPVTKIRILDCQAEMSKWTQNVFHEKMIYDSLKSQRTTKLEFQ